MKGRPPRSHLFPYTTLLRSLSRAADHEAVLFVRHDEQRLEPAQHAVGAPVLGQLDRSALQEALLVVADKEQDRKSTRLNSSHVRISYALFFLQAIYHRDSVV